MKQFWWMAVAVLGILCFGYIGICRGHFQKVGHYFRRVGIQTVFICGLSLSVLATLVLATAGQLYYHGGSFFRALFFGLKTSFQYLEGDSEELRALVCPNLWLRAISYILAVAVPLFTTGTVLALILPHIPRTIPHGKAYYIFSRLDSHSVLLARDVASTYPDQKNVFLFLRSPRDQTDVDLQAQLTGLRYRRYPYTEEMLLLWHRTLRYKVLRFLFLSDDTDENFQHLQLFLEAVEQKKLFRTSVLYREDRLRNDAKNGSYRQELYLLSETDTAPMLIDNLRKKLCTVSNNELQRKQIFRWTELRLLDRYRALSYRLMEELPLYQTARDRKNNILLLGFGRVGSAMFRTMVSFSSMVDHETRFTLCDQNIDQKYDAMKQVFRECGQDYVTECLPLDAESSALEQYLGEHEPFTVMVVCLGEDERNIRLAVRLKRYYRKLYWQDHCTAQPEICVNVEDPIKSEYVRELFMESGTAEWNRPIRPFGTDTERFSVATLMPRVQWRLAQELHEMLGHEPAWNAPLWDEYQRRCSLSCVCHAPYHVASLSRPDDPDYPSLFEARTRDVTEAEHRRWMDFVRSEGMQLVPVESAEAYYHQVGRRYVDVVGQFTPCLVPSEQLDDLQNRINRKRMNADNRYSFWQKDSIAARNALYFSQNLHNISS